MNKNARLCRSALQRTIIAALLALVTLVGWAQEKPDTITINFQLASKTRGEMVGVLYPDFMAHSLGEKREKEKKEK